MPWTLEEDYLKLCKTLLVKRQNNKNVLDGRSIGIFFFSKLYRDLGCAYSTFII
jgi:hypothetical protein